MTVADSAWSGGATLTQAGERVSVVPSVPKGLGFRAAAWVTLRCIRRASRTFTLPLTQ